MTSPTGLYTNPTPTNMSGTIPAYDTWYANNVRSGGAAGITTAHPDNGNGSIQFTTPTDSNAKADFEYYFTPANSFLLSDLTALSYDVYRSSTSTASAKYEPALRLYVSDGTHTGYLVYEGIYNNQPAPIDSFATVNVQPDYIWATGSLPGSFSVYNRTAADWAALLPSLRVYGLSTGVGSGWDGTFDGAVDNITFGTRTGGTTTYNFETNATPVAVTPEPTTLVMVASGIAASGLFSRRRKVSSSN
ncbi:MAG: PEP-CTERM sorting domain-containing protein [Janthinobacterium lividum]